MHPRRNTRQVHPARSPRPALHHHLRTPLAAVVLAALVVLLTSAVPGGVADTTDDQQSLGDVELRSAGVTTWLWEGENLGRDDGPADAALSWAGRDITVRSDRIIHSASTSPSYEAVAWFKSPRSAGEARVELREYDGDRLLTRQASDPAHLEPGHWIRVRVPLEARSEGGELELRIAVDGERRWQVVFIDDVTVRPTGSEDVESEASSPDSPRPTPSPTPDEPEPTQEPTTEPTAEPTEAEPTATPTTEETTAPATGDQVLSNGCAYSERGLPACGMYVGAAHGGNTDPESREQQVGERLGVRRTYFRADQVDYAMDIVAEDHQAGRLPWISFKLPHSWEDMASGRGDAWARDIATRLAATDKPVWIAFHHEPEGDGNIDAWTRMQERLAPLVRNTAPNVGFTVIVTGWNQFYGEDQYSLESLWPRGITVDVAGFDIYQRYGQDGKGWSDLAGDYFARIQPWAEGQGVAWAIAETGVTDEAAEARPDVIQESASLVEQYDGIAYTYFDSGLNSAANWVLSTPAKIDTYADAIADAPQLPRPVP